MFPVEKGRTKPTQAALNVRMFSSHVESVLARLHASSAGMPVPDSWRKPALHSNTHDTCQPRAHTHPHLQQQKVRQQSPTAHWLPAGRARVASAAPRWPRAGNPAWATASRRGCPSGTTGRHGPQSRGDVPSIRLAAGERIVQDPELPSALRGDFWRDFLHRLRSRQVLWFARADERRLHRLRGRQVLGGWCFGLH
jgi:hypothetical protein